MKRIFILFLLLSISVLNGYSGRDVLHVDFCQVYGSVYVETIRTRAHFRVYIEKDETLANLSVFKQTIDLYADKPGNWHFVTNRAFADFTIFIEPQKGSHDFTISYTETESFAGCK